jgi:CheY-like chemotaxis protein
LRDNDDVATSARSVLVVGPGASLPADLEAGLRQRGYFSEAVASSKDALTLASSLPFDVVLVAVEGIDLALREFVRGLRRPQAASHSAVLLALGDGPASVTAQDLLGQGVNRVVTTAASAADVVRAVVELVEAPPRVPLKAVIRFRVRTGKDEKIAMCQTEDVSATGVFVRTELAPLPGAEVRFELSFPGHREPIRGTAEVVRRITGRPDSVPGLGLRFLLLDGDGTDRLQQWLASHATETR